MLFYVKYLLCVNKTEPFELDLNFELIGIGCYRPFQVLSDNINLAQPR